MTIIEMKDKIIDLENRARYWEREYFRAIQHDGRIITQQQEAQHGAAEQAGH